MAGEKKIGIKKLERHFGLTVGRVSPPIRVFGDFYKGVKLNGFVGMVSCEP